MTTGLQAVTNLMVPASSSPNAYLVRETFSSTPVFRNFNNVQLDGLPFRPSGVIIDNTQGAGTLTVLINEMSYRIQCPAGQTLQISYPAPVNHSVNITGDGIGSVIFVDYPLAPFLGSAGSSSIPNPLPVTGPLTNAQLRASAVPISGALTDEELRASAVPISGALTNAELRAAAIRAIPYPFKKQHIVFSSATEAGGTYQLGPTPVVTTRTYIVKALRIYLNPSAYTATGLSQMNLTIPSTSSGSGTFEQAISMGLVLPTSAPAAPTVAQSPMLVYENLAIDTIIANPANINRFPSLSISPNILGVWPLVVFLELQIVE